MSSSRSRKTSFGEGGVGGGKSIPNFGSIKKDGGGGNGGKVVTVEACAACGPNTTLSYTFTKVVGNGSFGVVSAAKLAGSGEMVAIKRVLRDNNYKNRELSIMKQLQHCNVVVLKYFFYSTGERKGEIYTNIVMEFLPENLARAVAKCAKLKRPMPDVCVKLYSYQLFRSLAYIHSQGISHRDIKPENLLLDPESGVLKLCDFGSAKKLISGESNVSYICSRSFIGSSFLNL